MTLREAIEAVQGVEYSRHRVIFFKSDSDKEYQDCEAVIADYDKKPAGFVFWASCGAINQILEQYSPENAVQMIIERLP
jgi:hypothetical protein